MIISCHQPNFLPWSPYFEKIREADLFVMLENVQFTRHQFQNRFDYLGKWQTMPVTKGHLSDHIKHKTYLDPVPSWNKIKRNVAKVELDQFDDLINENLSVTNIGIINRICQILNISTPIVRDRESDSTDASQKLLEICLQHGATTYLSGPSGRKYLDGEIFKRHGIEIKYFSATNKDSIVEKIS